MKINFDLLEPDTSDAVSHPQSRISSPIKLQIESPLHYKIVQNLSPQHYQDQIHSMKNVINLPKDVSKFIMKEVQRQMSNDKKYIDVKQSQQKDDNHNQKVKHDGNKSKGYFGMKVLSQKTKQEKPHKINEAQVKRQKINRQQKKQHRKNKMGWVFSYKKHHCANHQVSQAHKTLAQVVEMTGKPSIYPSKANKKIEQKRRMATYTSFNEKPFNVYENLYKQAINRKMKQEVSRQMEDKNKRQKIPKINKDYFKKVDSKYIPLAKRMNHILETRVMRNKQKECLDITSGRELFKIDLSLSRESYRMHFNSLSKQKLENSQRTNSHITLRQKTIEKDIKERTKDQNIKTNNTIDKKTIDYFTQIFYPQENLQNSFISNTEKNQIKKQEFSILHEFLHEVQELENKRYEMETTVSSAKITSSSRGYSVLGKQDFKEKLSHYYNRLTLHDRQILRTQVWKKKKNQLKQEIIEEQNKVHTFKPVINIRSSSLDNLAKGHQNHIYFI